VIGPNNQKDSDLDGIGDSCDPSPNTPDGERKEVNVLSEVAISGTPVTLGQTPGAGTTPTTTSDDAGGGVGSPGVGSLAPVVSSIPAWAAIASGLGGAGLLGSLGALAARVFGIRRRRDDD
jgi:hypothetical protein